VLRRGPLRHAVAQSSGLGAGAATVPAHEARPHLFGALQAARELLPQAAGEGDRYGVGAPQHAHTHSQATSARSSSRSSGQGGADHQLADEQHPLLARPSYRGAAHLLAGQGAHSSGRHAARALGAQGEGALAGAAPAHFRRARAGNGRAPLASLPAPLPPLQIAAPFENVRAPLHAQERGARLAAAPPAAAAAALTAGGATEATEASRRADARGRPHPPRACAPNAPNTTGR